MSEHPKQPYAAMKYCADALVERLRPACERIEIGGSLRREKPLCSDIEIVAIPRPILNLIGEPTERTEVDDLLDGLPVTFTKRGRKYQQFWFDGTAAPFYVDLFLPNRNTWGMVYTLRTGSSEFSKRMVTAQSFGGYKPDVYTVEDGRVRMAGMLLPTPQEQDLFDLWKMNFVEPKDRA